MSATKKPSAAKNPAKDTLTSRPKKRAEQPVSTMPRPFACFICLLSVAMFAVAFHLCDLIGTGYQAALLSMRLEEQVSRSRNLKDVASLYPAGMLSIEQGQELANIASAFSLVAEGKSQRAIDLVKTKSFQNAALRAILVVKLTSLAQAEHRYQEIKSQHTNAIQTQERAAKKFSLLKAEVAKAVGYELPAGAEEEEETEPSFAVYERGIFGGLPVLPGLQPVLTVSGIQAYNKTEERRLLIEALSSSRSTVSQQLAQFRARAVDLQKEHQSAGAQAAAVAGELASLEDDASTQRFEVEGILKAMALQVGAQPMGTWATYVYEVFRERMVSLGCEIPELKQPGSPARRT